MFSYATHAATHAVTLGKCYEVHDLDEGFNRGINRFNTVIFKTMVNPVAKAYSGIIPKWGRARVDSFFDNLKEPLTLVNNILQGDGNAAGNTLGRFIINSTLGIFGLLDIASEFGVKQRPQIFDDTLAYYDFSYGMFSELPILGPSTVRGNIGKVLDFFLNPVGGVFGVLSTSDEMVYYNLSSYTHSVIRNADLIDDYINSSVDPYIKIRDSYIRYLANKNRNCKSEESIDYSLDDDE